MATPRVLTTDGKFFRLGAEKFYACGVAYGPFRPNGAGEPYASPAQTLRDFELIRQLGANLLRLYQIPPRWFMDLAGDHGLRLLIDIPWNKEVCFLETAVTRAEVRGTVRKAAQACGRHPAVFALSVVNEIRPDLVRWSSPKRMAAFIDELVDEVKSVAPACLCTFGNYPPTEYLRPREIDFHCFNVYLHRLQAFENYLARLQTIADSKPLMLGEMGVDTFRQGLEAQRALLSGQIEGAFRGGLAGVVVFSFTDDWHKEGREVADWAFGLTDRNREPKPAFASVRQQYERAPRFFDQPLPRVSVVVACYNGARTLKTCLDSLKQLRYPDCEVILVDDGSTDATPEMAAAFPGVRYVRHSQNLGLSQARNTGIAAATGEIVAFTDADCRADEDWLYYLVTDLVSGPYAGIGGPNLLPTDDSCVASVVMVSPGGPANVMLTDRLAEHIPGCNMAFHKGVLQEIGGFDPQFRKAGDDVDLCWRIQQAGHVIGFSPAGFVWHYRRSQVGDYMRQQYGYGEAEALLVRKHPERFNGLGGSLWRGRIYSPARFGLVFRPPRIYFGPFAGGFFQALYTMPPAPGLMVFTSLEYHVLVTLPLWIAAAAIPGLAPFAALSVLTSLLVCVTAAVQADIPARKNRFWSRPLAALLFLLQPVVRGWARYQGRLSQGHPPLENHETLESLSLDRPVFELEERRYWAPPGFQRLAFVGQVSQRLKDHGWSFKPDTGWNDFDLEMIGDHWSRLQLTTAAEVHSDGTKVFRCRLRKRWSLLARLSLGLGIALEFLLSGLLAGWDTHLGQASWSLAILGTTAAFAWGFHQRTLSLQRLISLLLDTSAEDAGLVRMHPPQTRPPASAPQPKPVQPV
jgi:GT2 family glycosyltransferase